MLVMLCPHHCSKYISMRSIPGGTQWFGSIRSRLSSKTVLRRQGEQQVPKCSSCGTNAREICGSLYCVKSGNQEFNANLPPIHGGKKLWNLFLLFNQEALGKGCSERGKAFSHSVGCQLSNLVLKSYNSWVTSYVLNAQEKSYSYIFGEWFFLIYNIEEDVFF